MKDETAVLIDENGLRTDGRRLDELRPIKIMAGVSNRADGSAYLEWGGNKVMAAVYGPRETHPRHKQETDRARVAFRYNMAPFSVSDRKRPGPDRRSWEISKVASEAFSNVVFLNEFPRSTIDVVVEVLQADAGTRCAAITCASVALADAGIPMKDMIVSCAAGKINGRIALDMHNIEDNKGEADLPLAIVPSTGEIVLLQMDGELSADEMDQAMDLIYGACGRISELQRDALRMKYDVTMEEKEAIHEAAAKVGVMDPGTTKERIPEVQEAPPGEEAYAGASASATVTGREDGEPAEPGPVTGPGTQRQPPWVAGPRTAPPGPEAPAFAPPRQEQEPRTTGAPPGPPQVPARPPPGPQAPPPGPTQSVPEVETRPIGPPSGTAPEAPREGPGAAGPPPGPGWGPQKTLFQGPRPPGAQGPGDAPGVGSGPAPPPGPGQQPPPPGIQPPLDGAQDQNRRKPQGGGW